MRDAMTLVIPELLKGHCPVQPVRQFKLQSYKDSLDLEKKELCRRLALEKPGGFDSRGLSVLVNQESRTVWQQDGVCVCGGGIDQRRG